MVVPRILVVEDEMIVAMGIKLKLENMGYFVCGLVSNGLSALKVVEDTYPDIILMDIILKGEIDGVETATLIKQTHDIPLVFLTGDSSAETMARALAITPAGFIEKPFMDLELEDAIENALCSRTISYTVQGESPIGL
ncbi:CheY-like chemotaxis protein [Methanohalophilus levihalophilus]|uniref:response regulator n=1 Tax=Methanohalophilus levihalophilus TaxID=1431282 RepID=UPI001AE94615|nr:response regulator [Methanohalophilus levihalophilus]MBP2029784.1 CheY-like chemotaxis protein [Methanohalophilus levihalophilus]